MTIDRSQLESPRLADFLPAHFESMDEDTKEAALKVAKLDAAGLPRDYYDLVDTGQLLARKASLTSWFDPNPKKSHIFCTDSDKFLKAMYLWNEHYMKGADCNLGRYFHRDAFHKYDMLGMVVAQPIEPGEPTKAALHAPRGSTKTITLVQELPTMVAVCRPNTSILLSETNATRTTEETHSIKQQIEDNTLIHADWGGRGELWQASNRDNTTWTDSELQFRHNGSHIRGASTSSKHRGRHPILGIIDDPEDDEMVDSEERRKKFISWLFDTYLGMFQKGGSIIWIGTIIRPHSCLMLALKGALDKEIQEWGEGEGDISRDTRFDDWHRKRIDLLYEDEDGELQSIFPDYLSPEGFEGKVRSMGPAAANREYRGLPIAEGELTFDMDPTTHGYMHCKKADGSEYFYDCFTGETMEWEKFLGSLYTMSAVDPASSLNVQSDYTAIIVAGINPSGVNYVLDVMLRRMMADVVNEMSFTMSGEWGVTRMGVEGGAMQNCLLRMAELHRKELESKGQTPPVIHKINNVGRNKPQRIIATTRPMLTRSRLRFLRFEPFTDADGVTHESVHVPNIGSHRLLWGQLETYTDSGASGHDDGPDALEMVLSMLKRFRGSTPVDETHNEKIVREAEEGGMPIERWDIPRDCWTRAMWDEHNRQQDNELEMAATGPTEEMDPYD